MIVSFIRSIQGRVACQSRTLDKSLELTSQRSAWVWRQVKVDTWKLECITLCLVTGLGKGGKKIPHLAFVLPLELLLVMGFHHVLLYFRKRAKENSGGCTLKGSDVVECCSS